MKLKLLLLLFAFAIGELGLAQTTRIKNFENLMESLNSGEQVRIVVHYAQCAWPDTNYHTPIPDAIAAMDIDVYEYFAQGAVHNKNAFVVFSNAKLIENPIGKGFVYNYGKVKISEDNSVEVTAKYIHPRNYKVLMDEVFTGKINDGHNGAGINLFK